MPKDIRDRLCNPKLITSELANVKKYGNRKLLNNPAAPEPSDSVVDVFVEAAINARVSVKRKMEAAEVRLKMSRLSKRIDELEKEVEDRKAVELELKGKITELEDTVVKRNQRIVELMVKIQKMEYGDSCGNVEVAEKALERDLLEEAECEEQQMESYDSLESFFERLAERDNKLKLDMIPQESNSKINNNEEVEKLVRTISRDLFSFDD